MSDDTKQNGPPMHTERPNLAPLFSDPMPEGMYGLSHSLALQYYVDPSDDYSCASGSKCLRAVRN